MTATPSFDVLLQGALCLPLEERSRMASRLIESLDEDVPMSPAWQAEVWSRVDEVRNGTLSTIPHDEVMAEARQSLEAIRQQQQSA